MRMTAGPPDSTRAPPFVLMAVIFFLSAQPNLNSGLGMVDTIVRKLVHAGEYAPARVPLVAGAAHRHAA